MISVPAENRTEQIVRRGRFWLAGRSMPSLGRLALVGLCVWALSLVALTRLPAASVGDAQGLYAREAGGQPFAWTSSRVAFPIRGANGPTQIMLRLGAGRWPGRQPPQVALASDDSELATFAAPDQPRTYRLLLPPQAETLLL